MKEKDHSTTEYRDESPFIEWSYGDMVRSMMKSAGIVATFVLVAWLVSLVIGWEFALIPSLFGSVILTLIINALMGLSGREDDRSRTD